MSDEPGAEGDVPTFELMVETLREMCGREVFIASPAISVSNSNLVARGELAEEPTERDGVMFRAGGAKLFLREDDYQGGVRAHADSGPYVWASIRASRVEAVVAVTQSGAQIEAYNREALAVGSASKRKAMEQYLLALAKDSIETGKRLREKYPDVDPRRHEIRDVKLEGEYPDTSLTLLVYNDHHKAERWEQNRFWDFPDEWYYARDHSGGRQIEKPEKLLGDIFMWARGG